MFLQACLPQCMLGYTPSPRSRHPPGADPPEQTPPAADTHPLEQTPPWSMLGDTVNARAVRILLECNLVCVWFFFQELWTQTRILSNQDINETLGTLENSIHIGSDHTMSAPNVSDVLMSRFVWCFTLDVVLTVW